MSLFIGYQDIEDLPVWAYPEPGVSQQRKVYVSVVSRASRTDSQLIMQNRLGVLVSVIDGINNVHYCYLQSGSYKTLDFSALNEDEELNERNKVTALYNQVLTYFMEKGWLSEYVVNATITFPKDIKPVTGRIGVKQS